jgi:hypothetical protein
MCVAALGLGAQLASASATAGPGALTLGIEAGGRTFDAMSVGDVRPHPQGEVMGAIEAGYAASRNWTVTLSWRFGGSWFDFTDGAGASGNIKDDSWAIRSFVDRRVPLSGGRALRFGLGYEYGEARSWVKTSASSDEGPHTFTSGGVFRAGIDQACGSRVELHADLEQAIYHAHATDSSLGNTYSWLGRAFSASVGVRFVLFRGRGEPEP